ncbi:hypothetical protein CEXT_205061 [Caerostris extrusa]|uniref:Uncharacterized protein n=1 Tax=Caerostris extrusa TaxID=172846 RepID=A0AAV4PTW7_CAEEX|nr:hypothetical protein CEXT_205061 [Caerostris extrusa]
MRNLLDRESMIHICQARRIATVGTRISAVGTRVRYVPSRAKVKSESGRYTRIKNTQHHNCGCTVVRWTR